MRRNPSIHIRLLDLETVLATLGMSKDLALDILEKSYHYRISNRYLLEAKGKEAKKISKVVQSEISNPEYFAGILAQERLAANHKGVMPVRPNTSDYSLLKEVYQMALDFTKTCEIGSEEIGLRAYIRTGLAMMGKKYSLNRFKTYHTKIAEQYAAQKDIDADEDREGTDAFYKHWKNAMVKHVGFFDELKEPSKYVSMIYGRQEADEQDAYYTDWIDAQFEGLAFLDAVPQISQFFGENAKLRYSNFKGKIMVKRKKSGA